MEIPISLAPVFWGSVVIAVLAAIVLAAGVTLLLGTVPHRKVALPLVWISASVLAAAVVAAALIAFHA